MKQYILLLISILGCTIICSADDNPPFSYVSCYPESGSQISSFQITLKFDLSKVYSDYGDGEYGVGYYGYYNKRKEEKTQGVEIYKGDKDTGELVTRFTETIEGTSDAFVLGDEITYPITDCFPEAGVEYTIYISNDFRVYEKGQTVPVAGSAGILSFFESPIVLTYTGVSASQETLAIESATIKSGDELESLNEVSFTFNQPISIGTGVCQLSSSSGDVAASSYNIEDSTITFLFDNVKLLNKTDYTLTLEQGAVVATSNSEILNNAVTFTLTGTYIEYIGASEISPDNSVPVLTDVVSATFSLPSGLSVGKIDGFTNDLTAQLYLGEVSEDNYIKECSASAKNSTTLSWSIGSYALLPSTKYVVYVPKGQFKFIDSSGTRYSNYYSNNEISITFTTLSIEEADYAPIEWGNAIIGTHGESTVELKDGDTVESLEIIEIAPDGYFYTCSNGQFRLGKSDTDNHYGYLYDVTSETLELISEVKLSYVYREQTMFNYYAISAPLRSVFYEGHKYRFVIPKDEYTIVYPPLYNYVRTEEYSVEFNGSTPTEAKLLSCTLQEGEEKNNLGNVVWKFSGTLELNPEAKAVLSSTNSKNEFLLTSQDYVGNTLVVAHIYVGSTGEQFPLTSGREYTLTLPEGTVYYPTDSSITNKEIAISFVGVDATSDVVEPEFINAEVNVNGFHTTTLEAVKDRQLNVGLIPDDNWKVTALTRDGNDVLPFLEAGDGIYTTPALTADTKIEATVEYDGVIINDIASDVVEIPDTTVKVYSDGEHIVVDGINIGDVVAVYSTNGMLIAQQTMNASNRAMQISITKGQVYIVRVNDTAVKIKH